MKKFLKLFFVLFILMIFISCGSEDVDVKVDKIEIKESSIDFSLDITDLRLKEEEDMKVVIKLLDDKNNVIEELNKDYNECIEFEDLTPYTKYKMEVYTEEKKNNILSFDFTTKSIDDLVTLETSSITSNSIEIKINNDHECIIDSISLYIVGDEQSIQTKSDFKDNKVLFDSINELTNYQVICSYHYVLFDDYQVDCTAVIDNITIPS